MLVSAPMLAQAIGLLTAVAPLEAPVLWAGHQVTFGSRWIGPDFEFIGAGERPRARARPKTRTKAGPRPSPNFNPWA